MRGCSSGIPRIAPTCPSLSDVKAAAEGIAICIQLAVSERMLEAVKDLTPTGQMNFIAGGVLVLGFYQDGRYPGDLSNQARVAHWWPNAMKDIARGKAHLRHMMFVRELVEQLPVIGILWGSVLTPA